MPKVKFGKTTVITESLFKRPMSSSSKRKPKKSILKKKHPLAGHVPRKDLQYWDIDRIGEFEIHSRDNKMICTHKGKRVSFNKVLLSNLY